ncbi:MAG: sodium:alanine symporter family protein [Firmicutes bacterium]|nr:sodium:alanine symporter family protein [Bacillota bacterium]
MLILIVGTGLYYTIRLKGVQFTHFGRACREIWYKVRYPGETEEGDISPFKALSTAIASTVGVGNIAGVETAIALGGPGAIFWMWGCAILGMVTNFAEVTLGVHFREQKGGVVAGGPMYYIKNGLNLPWLAVVFSIFGALAALGIGNMVQANSMADVLESTFSVPPLATAIVLAILVGAVTIGGIKRIADVCGFVVPAMAVFYIIAAMTIIIINITKVPDAFGLIFYHAFRPTAAVGGFAGSAIMMTVRYGVARGVFSNEAGLGSTPIAHSAAKTDHPVRQGVWGLFEVFVDTIVLCTMTALAILTTGVWSSGEEGASLTAEAFNAGLPGLGGGLVTVGVILFAYTTTIVWCYYGEKCAEYLFGTKIVLPYRIVWLPFLFIGALGGLQAIWAIADTLNALMAIPNLVGLILLSGVVIKLAKEFFSTEQYKEIKPTKKVG